MGDPIVDTMSYVETVEGVTLHKMVNNSWETVDETCRLDVMFDTAQNMHYVAAQTPSGKFPIRTYITQDISVQYVVTDNQFHTWWIPDENNSTDSSKPAESTSLAVDFAAMKGELTNLRKDLLIQFKKDLETAKEEIMTALRK